MSLSFSTYLGVALQTARELWPRHREPVAGRIIGQALDLAAEFASWPERPPADAAYRTSKIHAVMTLHAQAQSLLRGDR